MIALKEEYWESNLPFFVRRVFSA